MLKAGKTARIRKRRKIVNITILVLSTLATIIGLGFLFWIIGVLLFKGIGILNLDIFVKIGRAHV